MSDPNYENIDLTQFRDEHGNLDRDKLQEAKAKERRAYLYQIYLENGYLPKPQRYYAELFDVYQSRISRDLKKVREYVANNIDSEKARSDIDLFGDAIKKKLLEEDEYYKAWKVVSQKTEMLQELGEVEKAPDRHEIKQETRICIGDLPTKENEEREE